MAAVKGWQKTQYDLAPDLADFPNNFGVLLQDDDLVLDVDPRNFKTGDKPMRRLQDAIGLDLKKIAAIVQTGGGGWHLYFKKPAGLQVAETLPEYPGLEFKSRGRYVVGAGCVHPETGKLYELVQGKLTELQPAPQQLLDLILRERRQILRTENAITTYDDSEASCERYKSFLAQAPLAVQGEQGDQTTYTVACKGKTLGLSPDKTFALMREFYNPLCTPPWEENDLRQKVQNAFAYSQSGAGTDNPSADFKPVSDANASIRIRWDRNENGQLKKTLNNCANFFFLENSALSNLLAYDEFTEEVKIIRPAPWSKLQEESLWPKDGKSWTDEDTIMCRYILSNAYRFDVSVQVVDEAVVVAAKKNLNHPVRNWLKSLVWDGTPRLDTWLTDYCGSPDSEYVRQAGSKALIGAVARIFHPGHKFDYMLVLEGKQGTGKSTVVAVLGGLWYGDLVIDPHNKDTVAAMRGKWIIEASEMEVISRTEANALKAFLTRQTDTCRMAYARHTRAFARQSIFIGTVNLEAEPGYLKDMTGNRRFWPVLTTSIDTVGLRKMRDQIFAEAVTRYEAGEALYIQDENAQAQAVAEQHARRQVDPWTERIEEWLDADEFGKKRMIVSAMEIWVQCLSGMEKQMSRREQCRIANIMQHELKWDKGVWYHPAQKKPVNGYKRK